MSVDIVGTSRTAMTERSITSTIVTNFIASTAVNGSVMFSSTAAPQSPPEPEPEPMVSLVIRLSLITLIFLFTIVGNALTICVIKQNKALRSIKNYYYGYYLMNLSVSDLFVGVICIPFTVIYYQTEKWPFGAFFCKLMPTMQVTSISASISTLTYITFERYRAIVNPLKPRSSLLSLKITIAVIWMWSLIVGLPSFISYRYDAKLPTFQCQEQWETPTHRQVYTVFLFLVNYAVPLVFIFIAYALIIHELRGRSVEHIIDSAQNRVLHRRFVKLMLILVISFALCYLPNNVMFFLLDFTKIQDEFTFRIILNYSHVLVWLTSCLNPFIYGSLDSYFKRGYKRVIGISSNSDKGDQVAVLDGEGRYKGKDPFATQEDNFLRPPGSTCEPPPDFDSIFEDYKANTLQRNPLNLHSNISGNGSVAHGQNPSSSLNHSNEAEDRLNAPTYFMDFKSQGSEDRASEESKEIFISLDPTGYTPLLNKAPKKRNDLTRQNALTSNTPNHPAQPYTFPYPYYSPMDGFNDVPENTCLLRPDENIANPKGKLCMLSSPNTGHTDCSTECTESQTSSIVADDDESGFVSLVLYHDKDKKCLNRYVQGEDRERFNKKSSWYYYDYLLTRDIDELEKILEDMDETTL